MLTDKKKRETSVRMGHVMYLESDGVGWVRCFAVHRTMIDSIYQKIMPPLLTCCIFFTDEIVRPGSSRIEVSAAVSTQQAHSLEEWKSKLHMIRRKKVKCLTFPPSFIHYCKNATIYRGGDRQFQIPITPYFEYIQPSRSSNIAGLSSPTRSARLT
jgi:hypothetical protein